MYVINDNLKFFIKGFIECIMGVIIIYCFILLYIKEKPKTED